MFVTSSFCPAVQASIAANTYVISGPSQNKSKHHCTVAPLCLRPPRNVCRLNLLLMV